MTCTDCWVLVERILAAEDVDLGTRAERWALRRHMRSCPACYGRLLQLAGPQARGDPVLVAYAEAMVARDWAADPEIRAMEGRT